MSMENQVALVMGGGAGTGRATSLAFSREGARVAVADINEEGARETLRLIEETGGPGPAGGYGFGGRYPAGNGEYSHELWIAAHGIQQRSPGRTQQANYRAERR